MLVLHDDRHRTVVRQALAGGLGLQSSLRDRAGVMLSLFLFSSKLVKEDCVYNDLFCYLG